MAAPVLLVEFTTDDPDDTTPSWVDVTEHVRGFSTSRGRGSELELVEAGTATITLNNRERSFDPTADLSLRPMNRWRITAVLDGGDEAIFTGYAESYDQQWPAVGVDAVTVVRCVDEFKVLALDALPATDPPRDTYQDLVLFDQPSAYFPLLTPTWGTAAVGNVNVGFENQVITITSSTIGPILGQTPAGWAATSSIGYIVTAPLTFGDSLDATNLDEFTLEAWISIDGTPASAETLFRGPLGIPSDTFTWRVRLNTSRQVIVEAKNDAGTTHTVTGTTALTSAAIGFSMVWYHVVGTITDGFLRLYINGAQEGSTAWTGDMEQIEGGGTDSLFIMGNEGTTISSNSRSYDEVAFYKVGLEAERVLAHYTAGVARGFDGDQAPGDRVEAVLDAAGSVADRDVQTGTRGIVATYMTGQPPLDELRRAEQAENVDAILFIAKDGTVTFLADGYRDATPYDTVQATFDDDGTDLPYQDIDLDYSESFLFNEWNVTRVNGTTTTASDAASITAFFKRSRAITDLPVVDPADQEAVADALLAKYKDPITRIVGLELRATETIAEAVFPLDIGHRVRAIRTPPGAILLYPSPAVYPATDLYPQAGRIDQTSFIQRIDVDGVPGEPWRVRLGVSSL